MPESRQVIAVLNDLIFTVKIQEAARRAGLEVRFAKSWDEVLNLAEDDPRVIILDLNYSDIRPLDLISALKENEKTKIIPLLGYVAHVQIDMRQAAQARGCDVVVARSAFVQNLPEFLNNIGESESGRVG